MPRAHLPRKCCRCAHLPRKCFVTTGSLASFKSLLEEVLTPRFRQALVEHGYTHLEVQCGPDFDWFRGQPFSDRSNHSINIECLNWAPDIKANMLQTRGEAGVRQPGVVIGHAGSSLSLHPHSSSTLSN